MALMEAYNRNLSRLALIFLGGLVWLSGALVSSAQEVRLKDLVNIKGVRDNALIGYGLVVGLAGTGDSAGSLTTNQATANLLTRLGIRTLSPQVAAGNVAGVVVTADLAAFARNGDKIDVKVSTIGNATSLAGGTLLLTPLKAGDGKIYAVGQGSVVVGQANGQGPRVLTVARVPQGGTVEREFTPVIAANNRLTLSLKNPDFTTGSRIARTINQAFKGFIGKAMDVSTIEVIIPGSFSGRVVDFIARLENLRVVPDNKARVVLNERTGTVVMGANVVIHPVTIAHGDLSIRVGDRRQRDALEQRMVQTGGTTVGELIETMNSLGVAPADLVGILQSIRAAGALDAELKFL